jgi:uncharacterized protein
MKHLRAALVGLCLLSAGPVRAASFDCAKARAPDERAICDDRSLNDLDVRMSALLELHQGTVAMGRRDDIRGEQRTWLHSRQGCGADRTCIRQSYKARIDQLNDQLIKRLCGDSGPPC